MQQVGALPVTRLQFISGPTMIPIRAGNGTNERTMMHLLCELGKNLTDLNAVGTRGNWIEFTLGGPSRLGVPSIDMAHSSSIPKEDDMLGFGWPSCPFGGKKLRNGHAQQGGSPGKSVKEATTGKSVIGTVHDQTFVSWIN
jgi:hypothetical protein